MATAQAKMGGQLTSAIGQIPGVGAMINAALRTDPEIAYYWALELKGVISAHFTEVTGIKVTTEVQPIREGGNNVFEYRMIKGAKFEPIKIKRGFYGTQGDFYGWVRAVHDVNQNPLPKNKDFSLIVFNDKVAEVCRFNFFNGFVSSYSAPAFNATAKGQIAFEEIEIQYDYFEFVPGEWYQAAVQGAVSSLLSM